MEKPYPEDLLEAIEKKLPEWHQVVSRYSTPGPGRVNFLGKCKFCGQKTLYCIRNDFGHVDYEPYFAHICANSDCQFVIETEIQGVGLGDLESHPDYCPWCK